MTPNVETLPRPETKSKAYSTLSAIFQQDDDGTKHAPSKDTAVSDTEAAHELAPPPPPSPASPQNGEVSKTPSSTTRHTRSTSSPRRVSIIGFFDQNGRNVVESQTEAPTGADVQPISGPPRPSSPESPFEYDDDNDSEDAESDGGTTARPSPVGTIRFSRVRSDSVDTIRARDS